MQDRRETRVLNRIGARELSPEEVQLVTGGLPVHTNVCTLAVATGSADGDGCSDVA